MSLSSSHVLQVSAISRDPGVAVEHAIAVARAYLKFQTQEAAALAESYSGLLDDRVSDLHEFNSGLGPGQVHNRSCVSFRRHDDNHQVAITEVTAGRRDAFQPRRERMAIGPVRQRIRGK
jgi:hypothetical protein